MFLTGLWHGAGFTFIAWGLVQGVLILGSRLTLAGRNRLYARIRLPDAAVALVRIPSTFLLFTLSLVLFRAGSLGDAGIVLRALLEGGDPGRVAVDPTPLLALPPLAVLHWASMRLGPVARLERMPDGAFALGFGVATAVLLPFVRLEYRPFIYFQF